MTALTVTPAPHTTFTLPPGREAVAPPEHRGLQRDEVRLLVAGGGRLEHRRFRDLPTVLEPGDLLVINTSATLPAAVTARRGGGRSSPVHVSTALDDGDWVVEVRLTDGSGADLEAVPGERLLLPGGLRLHLLRPYPEASVARGRLWRARPSPATPAAAFLTRHGRPIEYGYLTRPFTLDDHQTVYATKPGSAETPSAGRPFTARLLVDLIARGVTVAPVVLHAGVSSPDAHEPPLPERFEIPTDTARLVTSATAAGRRVVAVGTTVVRALESATAPDGTVVAATGWTDLVLGPARPPRVVTGLVTGLHAPEASHLLLLEAVAGTELVRTAYAAALEHGYLWHEFGDSTLFLP